MSDVIRVVVADDHPLFREGLVGTINSLDSATVVAEASNGMEAVKAAEATDPDVVIMDLHMPETNGIEATRIICSRYPGAKVIVLTMLGDDDSIRSALRAGAKGYLLKESTAAQILTALESVTEGQTVLSPSVASRMFSALGPPGERPGEGALAGLTGRELEILELVAGGLTNTAIASRLFLSEKTVRNYVSNLFAKMQVSSRAEAVARARDAGFGSPRAEESRRL